MGLRPQPLLNRAPPGSDGRGANATRARHLALERRVAVKVIHPDLVLTRELAERFLAEARFMARIRHHHIMVIHAAGVAEGHPGDRALLRRSPMR